MVTKYYVMLVISSKFRKLHKYCKLQKWVLSLHGRGDRSTLKAHNGGVAVALCRETTKTTITKTTTTITTTKTTKTTKVIGTHERPTTVVWRQPCLCGVVFVFVVFIVVVFVVIFFFVVVFGQGDRST